MITFILWWLIGMTMALGINYVLMHYTDDDNY